MTTAQEKDMEKPAPAEPRQLSCEVCLKEIPASGARSAEVGDYVAHFCGLECYRQWQAKAPAGAPPDPGKGKA